MILFKIRDEGDSLSLSGHKSSARPACVRHVTNIETPDGYYSGLATARTQTKMCQCLPCRKSPDIFIYRAPTPVLI
uniref:Uncharacterized protein n=1 Tax=Zea mays TaxID=4577 RepID=C4J2N5_MAIZE|nr:unknown [Zea mays]